VEVRASGNEALWPDGPLVEPAFAWAFGAEAPLRCTLQPRATAASEFGLSSNTTISAAAGRGPDVSSVPERYGSLPAPAFDLRLVTSEALRLLQTHVSDVHAQEPPDYHPFRHFFQYYPNRCELQHKSA